MHDHAHASSTLLYDLEQRTWSEDLVGHAGLDAGRLPAIHRAGEVLGTLRPEVADALGLSRHCRVIVGTGDDHAGALGAGALAPGVIVDVTGTAEPVAVPAEAAVIDEQRLLETHAHAVDGMLLVENPGFVSGGSTSWWAGVQGVPQSEPGLCVVAGDRPGLLAGIAAALAANRLDIHAAQIHSRRLADGSQQAVQSLQQLR